VRPPAECSSGRPRPQQPLRVSRLVTPDTLLRWHQRLIRWRPGRQLEVVEDASGTPAGCLNRAGDVAQVHARYIAGLPKVITARTESPGKATSPDVQASGRSDPPRPSTHFESAGTRPACSHAGEGLLTERVCPLGTWPPPCLLHICSAVAVSCDSARYQAAAKWLES